MRQFQIRYKNPADFNKKLASIKASCKEAQHGDILFYLSWSKDIKSELDFAISRIRSNFPDAIYYGNEASGNISDGRLSYGISVTCYAFEDESSQVELAWVEGRLRPLIPAGPLELLQNLRRTARGRAHSFNLISGNAQYRRQCS